MLSIFAQKTDNYMNLTIMNIIDTTIRKRKLYLQDTTFIYTMGFKMCFLFLQFVVFPVQIPLFHLQRIFAHARESKSRISIQIENSCVFVFSGKLYWRTMDFRNFLRIYFVEFFMLLCIKNFISS
jgi:hypothetical protein